jgi:wyosine [tRNA(Phe)-imidazoG37] synthetase (radical SAM superfamily)
MDKYKIGLVFINSHGESLFHESLPRIIDFIHKKRADVRLLSNGYPLGIPLYRELANRCEEVIGELKNTTEANFQKTQRPLKGYTLAQYIKNLQTFRQQYKGKFIFEVTLVKGYNDDPESIQFLKQVVHSLNPDELTISEIDAPFRKVLGVSRETLQKVRKFLQ